MADAKISAFPIATPVTALDKFPLLQSNANVVGTVGQIKTFVKSCDGLS